MTTMTLPEVIPETKPYFSGLRIRLLPAVPMTQDQFYDFCQQNPEMRFERTAEGELIIMPPSGGGSGKRNFYLGWQFGSWLIANGTFEGFDSSTGFILPNGAIRSPDLSVVLKTRLAAFTPEEFEKFLPLCPDFIAELLSPSDTLKMGQEKMDEYIANGAKLGWLFDPRKKQVHVYRPKQAVQILDNPKTISGDPELPGFVLDLQTVWKL